MREREREKEREGERRREREKERKREIQMFLITFLNQIWEDVHAFVIQCKVTVPKQVNAVLFKID